MALPSKLSRSPSQSQTSITTDTDDTLSSSTDHPERLRVRRELQRHLNSGTPQNILLFLIAFRILNAFCVRTFFQPDEFFQSLEPAWQITFGKESGAWITWVRTIALQVFVKGSGYLFYLELLGMAASSSVVDTSLPLRCGLLHFGSRCKTTCTISVGESRSPNRSPQTHSSCFRRIGRLLYLEAGWAGLWTFQ